MLSLKLQRKTISSCWCEKLAKNCRNIKLTTILIIVPSEQSQNTWKSVWGTRNPRKTSNNKAHSIAEIGRDLQDSSQYYSRSQQCNGLYGLNPSQDLHLQILQDYSIIPDYDGYHCHYNYFMPYEFVTPTGGLSL